MNVPPQVKTKEKFYFGEKLEWKNRWLSLVIPLVIPAFAAYRTNMGASWQRRRRQDEQYYGTAYWFGLQDKSQEYERD
jgi:hypothetical protein